MGHTNSTTNYNLPQFLTTDKPAWLTDINGAFNAIDTGMHNAQTKADTADNNATQALTDAANAATAAAAADGKGAGALASTSDAFSTTDVYSVGDYVIYNSLLYRCTTAVVTPGPWTGSANWTRTTIETEINNINAVLNGCKYTADSSGNWKWKKYEDGTFDLWGHSSNDESNSWSPWGSVFSSDISGLGDFPFNISDIECITGSAIIGGANAAASITASESLTTAPGYIAIRGTTLGTGTRTIVRTLYVHGTYT